MVQIRRPPQDEKNNNAIKWKNLAVVVVGFVILLTMNLMLVHQSSPPDEASASSAGKFIQESSEISSQEFALGSAAPAAPVQVGLGQNDQDAASPPSSFSKPEDISAPRGTGTGTSAGASMDTSTGTSTIIPDQQHHQRHTYTRRGQPMSDADRQTMIAKWGSWTLVDTKERPQHDFYKEYPNRDVPRDKFPSNAWQIDKDYLAKFLPESLALVQRAQEAILAEYGKTEGTFEERSAMFYVEHISRQELNATVKGLERSGRGGKQEGRPSTYQGGWTTANGWEGLKRRMLHAVMTEDSFVFAMGGHSASAGHGNHFQQSYTLQVQWILEAVFARMGVRHQARNFGNGGLGTVHNGFGAGSVYGPDVDVLMWDSSMTEGEHAAPEVMARQQILGGVKVPAIWTFRASTAKQLFLHADADSGYVGSGYFGIDVGTSLAQIQSMPWAMQYVRCDNELSQLCRKNEYMGRCWIDRDDYTPTTEQKKEPGGRARWHPGNRIHQVTGRVLTFIFLRALKEALTEWQEAAGHELSDDAWHLTERYEKIRNKVKSMGDDQGSCSDEYGAKHGMGYVCNYGMQARSEFTPRSYPSHTSIRSLMRPEMKAVLGEAPPNAYNPPDVFNPDLHPPTGEIDVLNIVEAGVDFQSVLSPDYTDFYKKPAFAAPPKVPIGKGASLHTRSGDDFCDGSVDSFCNRGDSQTCLLYGHNDGRNTIMIDNLSGWLVMNLPDLKNGYIAMKMDSWHWPEENPKTEGWTTINNQRRLKATRFEDDNYVLVGNTTASSRRGLGKRKVNEHCANFVFEYAIDGKITALNKTEITERLEVVARVVEVITLLDDPNYTGGRGKEVEIAIRMRGCPRLSGKVFALSHVYWS